MKANNYLLFISILALTVCNEQSVWAQSKEVENNITTINGVVKEISNKKSIGYVNISVLGSNIGTVTNSEGKFSLKLKNSDSTVIIASTLGYKSCRTTVKSFNSGDITIFLKPDKYLLSEITIYPEDPRTIVKTALEKIGNNYPEHETMMTGFYREIVEKRRNCINISEAIIEAFKTSYNKSIDNDRIRIIKGRKIGSGKATDTIMVKLMGGPALIVNLDIVKDRNGILSIDELTHYNFIMEEPESINGRMQYVIKFKTIDNLIEVPQYYGRLFIDKELLAFSRAEVALSMEDEYKATKNMLYKKPSGLVFKPLEQSFLVTYNYNNGKSYLSYIKNTLRFKCDWKKRLFATNYSVISEMVITDYKNKNIKPFPHKLSFGGKDILYDNIAQFEDNEFWKQYIILEPTESLENAMHKLIKRVK